MGIRALRIGIAASALLLCLIIVAAPGTPLGSMGRWGTDHCAHYGEAIMFWHHGLAIYDTPTRELCAERSPEGLRFERATGLPDTYICEEPGVRPFIMNWQAYPRPYPPGALLYATPEALLYAHTSLSLSAVNRIALVKDVVVGHLLVLVLLEMVLAAWPAWAILLVPVVYLSVVPWTVAGIYDPISVLCVCLAVGRLDRERPLDALALLSLAALLHFRAIYYVPLGLVTLADVRRAPAVLRTRRGIVLAAGAVLALAAALVVLRLVGPFLGSFPRTNPVMRSHTSLALFVALVLGVVAVLVRARQWLLLALVAWQALIIGATRQAQFWHPMFLLPLLAIAGTRRARWPVLVAIVVLIVGVSQLVDGAPVMIARFFHDVVTLNV